jgi:hypothetical protein
VLAALEPRIGKVQVEAPNATRLEEPRKVDRHVGEHQPHVSDLAAGAVGIGGLDQLPPDLDPHEQRARLDGRPIQEEMSLRRAQLDLQRLSRRRRDARDVRDLEQVGLQRIDVLANARHGGTTSGRRSRRRRPET